VPFGLTRIIAPAICDRSRNPGPDKQSCRLNSYVMNTHKSEYIDQQIIKLQEAPELIPTGEMPRSLLLTVDRDLTDKCTPGNRIKVMGVLSITKKQQNNADAGASKQVKNSVQRSYIRVLGIQSCMNEDGSASSMGFAMPNITEEDQERFEDMKKQPDIYEKVAKSIAPSIFGHPDIKKAVACLLFGGCAKRLPDGMRLRGDINVLLLGDPSVAKSQFLKFVDRVAPISVYTSGKGSSAAGLTASVIKDPSSGDF
jgi:DNA replication licensing factor MCM5